MQVVERADGRGPVADDPHRKSLKTSAAFVERISFRTSGHDVRKSNVIPMSTAIEFAAAHSVEPMLPARLLRTSRSATARASRVGVHERAHKP